MSPSFRNVLSKILIPGAAVISSQCNDISCCKRSDLPIYTPEGKKDTKKEQKQESLEYTSEPLATVQNTIRTVRVSITSAVNEVKSLEDEGRKLIHEGVGQVRWVVNYLGDSENSTPKIPAIAIGGLTGYILALRGCGKFKRFLFTSAGALVMASLCYPEEAKQYSQIAYDEGRNYATIAYNFAYGVKKGDPPRELPSLPKLPTTLTELWGSISGLVASAPPTSTESLDKSIISDKSKQTK